MLNKINNLFSKGWKWLVEKIEKGFRRPYDSNYCRGDQAYVMASIRLILFKADRLGGLGRMFKGDHIFRLFGRQVIFEEEYIEGKRPKGSK